METNPRAIRAAALLAEMSWVQALARSLVRDASLADDIAQDTWLTALERPPRRGRDRSSLRAWLARVTRTLARQSLRSQARRERREHAAARPEARSSTAEIVARGALHRQLVEAVMALEEPYRSTVLFRHLDELSVVEIARRCEVSPAAVRQRLSRGLEQLRCRLDRELGGDRSSWMALLIPFSKTSASVLLAGATLMAKSVAGPMALAIAAGLLVGAALWWTGVFAGGDESISTSAPESARELAILEPSDRDGDERESGELPREPDASTLESHALAVEPPTEAATALDDARSRTRLAVERSLAGILDPDAILEAALAVASLEVDDRGVPKTVPDGSLEYPLLGTPEGMQATLLIRRPTRRPEELDLAILIALDPPPGNYVLEGAARRKCEVQAWLTSNADGELVRTSLLTNAEIWPQESARLGMPLQGKVLDGVIYSVDPRDPSSSTVFGSGFDIHGNQMTSSSGWESTATVIGNSATQIQAMGQLNAKLLAFYGSIGK